MSRVSRRLTQASCSLLVLLSALPWASLTGDLLVQAVHSRLPLTLSFAAWLVMLVPIWVCWFAVIAWQRRHETSAPAIVMAAPLLVVATAFMLMPAAGVLP